MESQVPSVVERLLAFWATGDPRVRPGVPASRIDAFEAEHGVRLPDDLRAYFSRCDGTEYGISTGDDDDRGLIEFWPLERLERSGPPRPLPGDLGAEDSYFTFADYLISSAIFAIRLTADPSAGNPVIRHYGPPVKLADSFAGFVRLYLDRPEALLGHPRRPPLSRLAATALRSYPLPTRAIAALLRTAATITARLGQLRPAR